MSHLLAADIGGTKAMVALASGARPWPNIVAQHGYACADINSLEDMLDDFLARPEVAAHAPSMTAACFSVAGPVAEGGTTLTNLGWRIEASALAARFGWPAVALI